MINLDRFFQNHFDTDKISDANFNKFTTDHLNRLAKAGTYPALLAALQPIYAAWSGSTLSEATNTAIRESYTRSVQNAVDAIRSAISQQEGTVRGKFGKDSPAYQEFFPQGVTDYNRATLGNIQEKLSRFLAAATAHSAELGAPFVTQFTALRDTFKTARDAQLASKGSIATDKSASATTRDQVETQLMKNLLTIAITLVIPKAASPTSINPSSAPTKKPIPKPRRPRTRDSASPFS